VADNGFSALISLVSVKGKSIVFLFDANNSKETTTARLQRVTAHDQDDYRRINNYYW
jgi:hypothetical protein